MKFNQLLFVIALFSVSNLYSQSSSSQGITKGEIIIDNPYISPKQNPTDKSSNLLSEGFEDITNLVPNGWFFQNNSNPIGTQDYEQGYGATTFPAYDGGTDNDYICVNYNSCGTAAPNTISNWMITPELALENGAVFSFYTRGVLNNAYADRLQVRLSTSGISTDIGGSETSVGDFTTLLVDINPSLIAGEYPDTWTLYEIEISGLTGVENGRIGFRYFVEDGGLLGTNSNYIGIDRVELSPPPSVPLSNWAFVLIGLFAVTLVFFKFRK